MPVEQQTPFNEYTGNGVTTVFAYQFQILIATDLAVFVDGALKANGTDYTISGVGNQQGGQVTLSAAPASGADVLLAREMVLARDTDYQTNGDLREAVLDRDFDRIWLALQGLSSNVRTSLRFPFPEIARSLPDKSQRIGKILSFDSLGQAITVLPTSDSAQGLRTELSLPEGSSLVGYESGTVKGVFDGITPYGPTDPVDWFYGGPQIRRPMFSTQDLSIFVDPSIGLDTNPGTQTLPIKTLKEAVQRIPEKIFHKVRVYLLDGTYPDNDPFKLFNYYVTSRGRAGLRFIGHIAMQDGEAHPIYTDTNPGAVVVHGFEHTASGIVGTEEIYFAGMTIKNGWFQAYDSYCIFDHVNFTGGHRTPGYSTYHAIGGHYCNMDFRTCNFSDLAQIGTFTEFMNMTYENCTLTGLHTTSDAANPGRPFMLSNRSTVYLRNSPTLLQTGPGGKTGAANGGSIYDFDFSSGGYNVIRRSTPDRDEAVILLGHDGGALGSGRGGGLSLNGVNHPTEPGQAIIEFAGSGTSPKAVIRFANGSETVEGLTVTRYGEITSKANLIFSSQARALSGYLANGQATLYTNPTTGDVFVVSKMGGVMKYARLLEFATAPVLP